MSVRERVHLDGGCAPVLDDVVRRLCEWTADGVIGDGVQLCVSHNGELLVDIAIGTDGVGRPNLRTTLYTLWCTGKPLTALAIAQLVDAGRLDYDDTVGATLGARASDRIAERTIRDLLTHRAGLHHLTAQRALLAGPRRRTKMALRVGPRPGWPDGTVAYSEHGAWEVLGAVIAELTGESAGLWIRQEVITPLGLDDDLFIVMTDDDYSRNLDRMGVNVFLHGVERIPLLYERTRTSCTEEALGYGARGSARSLEQLYRALLHAWHQDDGAPATDGRIVSSQTLRYATSGEHPLAYDRLLGRECRHGLGFFVDLSTHDYGDGPSSESFGHSGYGGASVAFADPTNNLVIAALWNGHIDSETSIALRRRPLVSAVYRLLGLTNGRSANR